MPPLICPEKKLELHFSWDGGSTMILGFFPEFGSMDFNVFELGDPVNKILRDYL
jgi:hypothetical protein